MQLNALDRALAYISPRRAYERMAYRAALEVGVRAYDAAKQGRRGDGWITSGSSANAEISAAAATIRARARDHARNNPYAANIVSKMTSSIWGTGIVPRLKVEDSDDPRRARARDVWNWFCDAADPAGQLDFYGLMKLGIRALNESGEYLIRRIPRDPRNFDLKIPLQIEILEADYIDSAKNEPTKDGGVIIQGIEFDAYGRRVAYWLFDEHPGDTLISFAKRSYQSRRVDAANIRHVFEPLRPGQARGVSIFTPVVLKFRDIDDYEDSTLMAAKVAACFAVFVTPPAGPAAGPLAGSGRTETNSDGSRNERLSPGMMKYLKAGEEVTVATPPTLSGGLDFIKQQLRAAAVGSGVTYEMATGDLSNTNFSSIRIGRNDFLDLIDQKQWLTVIPVACNPVWQWVGQTAALVKQRNANDPWQAVWTPPARRLMDPKSDIEAEERAVRAGFKPLSSAIAATTGEDIDEQVAEIARCNALLDENDIVLDCDPRRVGKTSAPMAQQAQAAEPAN